ncbi:Amino acid adenylation [Xenorhabdus mauleonii]|uniref:Amino acid adenylation n=2 Tax=Xenorhabdus mauleonii TaxID=351675 RepID=A0A1I3QTM4_9GAMM|nr:Amino acid adenylation [Xenorhabdus mauleonii]SFJ36822.1 amino acid adenylation domain-containing protein [Xenorhabdus mauleonii]
MNLDDLKRAVLEKRLEEQLKARGLQQQQPSIKKAKGQQPIPLSFAQQRLWFLSQLDPAASQAYHLPVTLRLAGQLNRPALKAALDRLIARHESLRTRFVSIDEQPCQQIDPADIGFTLSYHDLRQNDPALHAQQVSELAELEAQAPFDFAQGPLIRGQLLQLNNDEHVLLLTLHHIITDGWSVGVLVRELGIFYRAALDGLDDPLPPLPIQYADYAFWQHEQWQKGQEEHDQEKQKGGEPQQAISFAKQRDFWASQLAGAPALLPLPTDRPRPAVQTYRGGQQSFHLDAHSLASLKALGQRHNCTLFMTVLAAWSGVLNRLTGLDDIVIGTPVANRPQQELEGLIGFFVNTLALRVRFHSELNVADLLAQIRQQALAAYAHQDLPFEQVVEALQPERSLSYSPIFQVMMALNNTPTQALTLPGLQLTTIEQARRGAHFDLTLSLSETETGLVGDLEYAADLFDAATIERIVGYLVNILTAMAADETQTIASLPMLPASELQQLLNDFSQSPIYSQPSDQQDAPIHLLFEQQVARRPDAIALEFVCEHQAKNKPEKQAICYGELNRRANQLAHHLIALGVRPDDRIAICLERSPEMIIGLLGILKAGGAYVPLDPAYPAERLAYIIEDASPVALLTDAHLMQTTQVATLSGAVPVILLDSPELNLESQPSHNPPAQTRELTSCHLAYVIYTSGSTGKPKGVMAEHRNVNQLVINNPYAEIRESDCVAHCANVAFDASTWEIWSALLNGARLYIIPQSVLLDPARFCVSLIKGKTTAIWLTSGLFNEYLDALQPLFGQLRYLITGGDVVDPRKIQQIQLMDFPPEHMICAYGPTETTTFATTYRIDASSETPIDVARSIPIGRPIAHTRTYLLDPQGHPVPLGVSGEIYIGGAGVTRGYLNQPELTAERFLPDPFSKDDGARMYKSGDLGRWLPDGNIEFLGRNDFQVKLRGFRIELGEIEAKLLQCHGVSEAIVLMREDEANQKRLVAYLLAQDGVELQGAELRQQLAQHLADFMLPSAFVVLDAFPLTPNGKVDRQALPVPALSAIAVRHYESPVGEAENTLAQIWQDLLGLAQVGRHDHFFELGGHSLMIVSLIEKLRGNGWKLDVRSVFSTPVLADMAQAIQRAAGAFVVPANRIPDDCSTLVPDMLPLIALTQPEIDSIVEAIPAGAGNIQDIYPLAPLQKGILFHYLMQEQGDTYLLQSLLAFDTRARLDAFMDALQQVINRHDILRTSVHWQGLEQPAQVVWRQAPLGINVFTPISPDDVPSQLLAHTDPRRHRINLNQAPLFAADIACDPVQDEWLLALRFHHLVSDHMTLELIFSEIALILQGNAGALPTPLPYRNFIAQILNDSAAAHEAYFHERLADIDAPTAPFGILSVPNDNTSVAEARFPLAPALSKAIRAQARQLKVSPSVLFHAAWANVLAQTSGRDDVVFGSVLLGRLQGGAGADQILGMFINTLPVRVSLAGRNVQSVVQDTYLDLMQLLEHEQAPLALAQGCSGIAHSLPLFSALLNYRHSHVDKNGAGHAQADKAVWAGMRVMAAQERTNYPITLSVDDLGEDFYLTAHTIAGIDPASITGYLQTAVDGLVNALAHNPQQLILDIPILSEAEQQQILVDFNPAQTDFPQEALIHQLFEAQVTQQPDAIAVIFDGQTDNEHTLSYSELNQRANQLAHHLIALGVRPDDRIAICLERSPEMIVGLLGILKAGGAYVPLDPTYPAERLAYIIEDASPVALLTDAHLMQTTQVATLSGAVPVILLDSPELNLESQPPHNPPAQTRGLTSRHLAYVIYTSGSTGRPKGVMAEHRNVNQLVINNPYAEIKQSDCVAHCANVAFDASTWEIWSALLNGARLHVISQSVLLDPARFCESLIKGKTTTIWLTSGLFNEYLDALQPLFGQLRYLITGGDILDPRKIQRVLSANAKPAHLINGYGPTETTTFATTYRIDASSETPIDVARSIPIGRPIAHTRIYILDPQGRPVPRGARGEIYIGGAGVARGYLNQPELTAERFLPDPFTKDTEARMYNSGDLGRWLPDGNIEFLGRNDFQVKLRGFRIELGEIEAKLLQCHGVNEAIVLMREDEANQKRLVAYLRAQDGVELQGADLRQQLAQHLADFMLPSAFVVLDAFPLTPNGKLDRQALPAPDSSAIVMRRYEAPNSEEEMSLAKIWQELLGLERIGRHDNFFELGGHSLMIVQLATRIEDEFMVDIPISQLFLTPILAEQVNVIFAAQMDAIGKNDIESLQNALDSMSAEELAAILGGDNK